MTETATFALGCFWQPDDFYSKLPGVIGTQVGYSGGEKKSPTYYHLGDHTETIQIEFDPKQITYNRLLDYFWQQHDPVYPAKTQYKSIIFYHDERQRKLAEVSKEKQQRKSKGEITTEIRPAKDFYLAEEYHQKYLKKNNKAVC